jgi:hypothetical protein
MSKKTTSATTNKDKDIKEKSMKKDNNKKGAST